MIFSLDFAFLLKSQAWFDVKIFPEIVFALMWRFFLLWHAIERHWIFYFTAHTQILYRFVRWLVRWHLGKWKTAIPFKQKINLGVLRSVSVLFDQQDIWWLEYILAPFANYTTHSLRWNVVTACWWTVWIRMWVLLACNLLMCSLGIIDM